MSADIMVVIICLGIFGFAVVAAVHDQKAGIPQARAAAKVAQQAKQQAQILCPHCHVRGRVTTRQVKRKKGISGGKATGAVLTGGISMLATGLSRKEVATEMTCRNCGTVWNV